jgi:hypothetical protein
MAKARKEGKPRRNRGNLNKNMKRIARNHEVLKQLLSQNENTEV